ncbi:hypothetical protein BZG72_11170 [Salinivibrio sp. PR6]|uniref:hypothetical protein n=1 Tax=Salinivibrio sp. PR6 TaxID=1909485 RepID=UPI000989748C|nr:hypothetical protein [Salinivibrio sp. PR6]OOE81419.1 hypothetical protein BZG72_11170 [Salinivibrio sp. PR6]
MSVKITGMDSLQKKLKKMADGARELDGQHQVAIPDLLTESFLAKHTKFTNAQELFDNSGFKIDSPEDFKAIPDDEWDQYISSVSSFESWNEMLQSATAEYAKRKMGLSS